MRFFSKLFTKTPPVQIQKTVTTKYKLNFDQEKHYNLKNLEELKSAEFEQIMSNKIRWHLEFKFEKEIPYSIITKSKIATNANDQHEQLKGSKKTTYTTKLNHKTQDKDLPTNIKPKLQQDLKTKIIKSLDLDLGRYKLLSAETSKQNIKKLENLNERTLKHSNIENLNTLDTKNDNQTFICKAESNYKIQVKQFVYSEQSVYHDPKITIIVEVEPTELELS